MEKIKRVKASQIPDATNIDGFKAFGIKVNADGTIDNVKVPMDLLKGNKGDDGTVSFEELTEEQRLSLKGDKGVGVPIGGTTGQQLVKKSNVDYDFEWKTPEDGGDITKADIGLGNVDNTSDVNKPVSTAQQSALDAKIDADKFQVVAELPTSPVTGVFYFVTE